MLVTCSLGADSVVNLFMCIYKYDKLIYVYLCVFKYDKLIYVFLRVLWAHKGRNPSPDLGDQGMLLEEVKLEADI